MRTAASWCAALAAFATFAPVPVSAQTGEPTPGPTLTGGGAPWSCSVSVYQYFEPEEADYLQPTVAADRGPLHLETRANYEDIDTASLWVGVNLGLEDGGVDLELTPMIAAVVGATDGIALGFELSLSWKCLELTSEGEYVFDSGDSDASFFYSWSDLGIWPWDWLGVGVADQRTKTTGSDLETELGIFVAVAWNHASITAYVFGLDRNDPTVIVGADLSF
jgi:hypothetical protein